MASYKVVVHKSVARDLRVIPSADVKRLLKRIEALAHHPRPPGCEKLPGQECYRVRQGIYRIIYEINDGMLTILVIKVGHRKEDSRQR